MADPAKKKAAYQDLFSIPENMTGEILGGELIVTPRPSARHALAASVLGGRLLPPFQFGEGGGPGDWVILHEPEVLLGEDLLVPDLAGWRKERFPGMPAENWFSVAPDWVCEILSPGTVGKDRARKMPVYARHAVKHLWIIDPAVKTLEVFRLESGKWLLIETFAENARVRAEPFLELELDLAGLWWD